MMHIFKLENLTITWGHKPTCAKTNKFSLSMLRYFVSKRWNMVPLEIIKILEVSKYSKQKFEIGSLKIVTVTYVGNLCFVNVI